jgi:hypothetical protein
MSDYLFAELIEKFDEVRREVSVTPNEWAHCHLLIAASIAHNAGLTRDQFLVVVRAAIEDCPGQGELSLLDPRAIRSGEAYRAAFVAMAKTASRRCERRHSEVIVRASLSEVVGTRRLSRHQLLTAIKHYYDEAEQ